MKLTGNPPIGAGEVPATRGTLMALNPAPHANIAPEFALGATAKRWFGLPGIVREPMPNLQRWYALLATRSGFKRHVDVELS